MTGDCETLAAAVQAACQALDATNQRVYDLQAQVETQKQQIVLLQKAVLQSHINNMVRA